MLRLERYGTVVICLWSPTYVSLDAAVVCALDQKYLYEFLCLMDSFTGLLYFTRTWLRYIRVYAVASPSVCLTSVTFVRPTQPINIFGNVSSHLVPWPSADLHAKFYGDRARRTLPSGAKMQEV